MDKCHIIFLCIKRILHLQQLTQSLGSLESAGISKSRPPTLEIPPAANPENRAQNEAAGDIGDIGGILRTKGAPPIYRLGHSDKFACHNCRIRGDKWDMEQHECRGNGKDKSRARAKTPG
jgi:hypothetical protein